MKDHRDMVEVVFTKECHLPRFIMKEGEKWQCRKTKITNQGMEIGGGIATNNYFKIIN